MKKKQLAINPLDLVLQTRFSVQNVAQTIAHLLVILVLV